MKTVMVLMVIGLLLLFASGANAQIPQTISYQGVLCDASGNPMPDGTYSITFRLYLAATGGTAIWSEPKSLQATRGMFYTLLGSAVSFGPAVTFDKPYWISLQVGTDAELSPRMALASTPYTFHALNADTTTYAKVAGGGGSNPWQTSGTNIYYNSGNVGVGIQNPGAPLEVNGRLIVDGINGPNTHDRVKIDFYPSNMGHALGSEDFHNTYGPDPGYPNSVGHKFYVNGNNLAAQIGIGGFGFSGNNMTSYFAGNVGIGTSSPAAKLEVDGSLLLNGTTGATPTSGPGARLMWTPAKAAFRAGYAGGTQWDDANVGTYSTAIGHSTTASNLNSTAMGDGTTASGGSSTAMGSVTVASGDFSIAMGYQDTASGQASTATGNYTAASGNFSTAMGSYVSTNKHLGSFIIGDYVAPPTFIHNDNDYQFMAVFSGGYRLYTTRNQTAGVYMNGNTSGWTNISDRNTKENFRPVDGEKLLSKIRVLPITRWNYKKTDPSIEYIGPVAQDFYAAFHLGGKDSLGINSICIDGVNMAAVQALEKRTTELREKTAELQARTAELDVLKSELADLKARLARVEQALSVPRDFTQQVSNENGSQR